MGFGRKQAAWLRVLQPLLRCGARDDGAVSMARHRSAGSPAQVLMLCMICPDFKQDDLGARRRAHPSDAQRCQPSCGKAPREPVLTHGGDLTATPPSSAWRLTLSGLSGYGPRFGIERHILRGRACAGWWAP